MVWLDISSIDLESIHHRNKKKKKSAHRHRRKRDKVAQNRQDKASFIKGKVKGYKKILVLYTNYGKLKKPEKTNWVMHQYHLGNNEDEKEGELVVSKIFYQTQPRQCSSMIIKDMNSGSAPVKLTSRNGVDQLKGNAFVDQYYHSTIISFGQNHGSNVIP